MRRGARRLTTRWPRPRQGSLARSLVVFGLPLAAVIALTLAMLSGPAPGPTTQLLGFGGWPESHGILTAEQRAHHAFHITGRVRGLYPGAHLRLRLTVTNPNRSAITVRTVRTRVGSAAKGCPASYVRVGSFTGRLRIAGHGHRTATVSVQMERTAPNACQGRHFSFQYRGTATQK